MKLSTLLAGTSASSAASTPGASDPDIWSLSEDSRTVREGALFFARAGTRDDGARFVVDAIGRGAVAVAVPAGTPRPSEAATIAWVETDDVPQLTALVAERFHGAPTSTLALIGVTGTNGKTTIAYLVQQLLAAGGMRAGLVGTVETDDGRRRAPSALTTPPAIELSSLFARMLDNGCTAAAMEVSSHSLDQRRVAGLRFRTTIFTNLTGDHLDYHGTMERYAGAKARLFAMLDSGGTAIVNADDPWHASMRPSAGARLLRASLEDPGADCHGAIRATSMSGMEVLFRGPWGEIETMLPLVGRHNAMNALEAAAAAWSVGVGREALAKGLATCEAPPGRLQPVAVGGAGFSVLVDYAHSDDALANVLRALRPTVPAGGRLRVVFGCGGDRDRTKRPRMAAVACAGADEIVVTSDNPRTEDPASIIDDILAGVPDDARARVEVEVDRARAIRRTVESAREGDVILIAGKGHEDYQIVGHEKRSFDDRREAAEAIRARTGA